MVPHVYLIPPFTLSLTTHQIFRDKIDYTHTCAIKKYGNFMLNLYNYQTKNSLIKPFLLDLRKLPQTLSLPNNIVLNVAKTILRQIELEALFIIIVIMRLSG